tara:strand:+ start:203 stop:1603 length:1401 start_codon:yes stop_codon:yes gene_type:complete
MGKKSGGSSQPQQVESKTYQSRLPEYAAPYYHNLVGRAQALSYEDYIPYEAARVAGFSPEQLGAQEGFKAIAQRGMPLMDTAGDVASYASQAGPMMTQSGYQAGPIQSQYGGSNIQSRFRGAPVRSNYRAGPIRSQYAAAPIRTGVQGFGPQDYMRAARGFDDRSAQKYMNPYLSNVLDRQQSRATDRFNEQRAARNQRAIQSGAFGGSRQAIADSLAQREMNQSLQDMEAKGLSDAFTQAQSQFQRDRDARFKGLTSADAGQLALAKQRSGEQIATEEAKRQAAAQNLQAQIARGKFGQAAGQMDLEGQMARDKSYSTANQQMLQAMIAQDKARQTQGSQDLQSQLANQKAFEAAMGRGLKGSQVLAGLTKGEQDLDMQRLKALSDVGSQRQAMMQRAYDTQYEDFLTQREYPYQQLERFSAILQGMPTRPDISERMYTPQANPMGQMLQTGLGAYGAFKGMGGG